MENKSAYKKRTTKKDTTSDQASAPVVADPNETELLTIFKKILVGLQTQVGDPSDSLSAEAKNAIAQYDAIREDLSVATAQSSVSVNRQWTLPEADPNVAQ